MDAEKIKQAKQREKVAKRRELEKARAAAIKAKLDKEQKLHESLAKSRQPVQVPYEFQKITQICPKFVDYLDRGTHVPQITSFNESLRRLMKLTPVRDLKTWKPHGKSAKTLFKSLAEHLVAKYKMPAFVWSAFFIREPADRDLFINMVEWISAGYSLHEFVKGGGLRVQLTKKSCHEFLQTPADYTIMHGLRRIQVKSVDGDHRLYNALVNTNWGRSLSTSEMEAFWQTVLAWFAKQAMLDPEQVGPMFDYIGYQKGQNPDFTMKGRTATALLRDTQIWHAQLARTQLKGYRGASVFAPSGFKAAEYDMSRDNKTEIWRLKELLTAKDLADEGKRQSHCVFSYHRGIESGQVSIWVLTKEDNTGNWAMLTVEVRNQTRQIVQARGRYNRMATQHEMMMLNRWAGENGLTTSNSAW